MACFSRTLDGKTIYIPKEVSVESALREAVEYMVGMIDRSTNDPTGIDKADIERMIAYAMQDLKDGKVLRYNIDAGKKAGKLISE